MTGKKKGRGKKPKGTTSNESSPAKSLTPGGSAHNTPLKRVSEEGTSSTPVKIRSPGPKSKTMAAETTPVKTRSPGPKSKTMPADTTPVKATTSAIAAILESHSRTPAKKGTTTPVKSVESAEPEPEPATPDTAADESASSKEPTPVKTPKPSPFKVMPSSSSSDSDTDDGIVNDAESVIVSESEAGSAKKKPNKSPKVTPLKVKLKVSGPPAKKRLDLLRMPSYLGPRKEPSTAGATQIDIASSPSLLLAATRAGRKSAGTFSSPKTPKTPKSATKRSTPGGSPSTPTTGSSKAGPSGAKRAKTSKTTWYSRTRKEPKSPTFIDDDSDDDFIGPTPEIERPKTVAVPSTDDSSDSEGEIIVDPKNMEPTQAEAR